MKRFTLTLAILGCLALSLTLSRMGSAEPPAPSEAAREQIIREFKRTGLNTTPGDAMFLRILVAGAKAKRGVEVGSATGFGAINMGIAFERNGGELITIDIDRRMVEATRQNVAKMGLEKTVKAVEGDALKVLATLEGQFDFVFIDALKRDYLKYFKLIEPRLKAGAVVVADNVIQSANEVRDFLEFMEKSPDYEMVVVRSSMDKNDGMAVCYKKR